MAKIESICDYIAGTLLAGDTTLRTSGSKPANKPPEKITTFPQAVVFPRSGSWMDGAAGTKKGIHTIVIQIHVARKDLPRDIDKAFPYGDTVPDRILSDPTLGGNVDTVVLSNGIRYIFGPLDWADSQTLGFEFEIDVKAQNLIGADLT